MFERYYSFFHYCLLSYRYVMFQKRILCKPKWGAQAVVRWGTASSVRRILKRGGPGTSENLRKTNVKMNIFGPKVIAAALHFFAQN